MSHILLVTVQDEEIEALRDIAFAEGTKPSDMVQSIVTAFLSEMLVPRMERSCENCGNKIFEAMDKHFGPKVSPHRVAITCRSGVSLPIDKSLREFVCGLWKE